MCCVHATAVISFMESRMVIKAVECESAQSVSECEDVIDVSLMKYELEM